MTRPDAAGRAERAKRPHLRRAGWAGLGWAGRPHLRQTSGRTERRRAEPGWAGLRGWGGRGGGELGREGGAAPPEAPEAGRPPPAWLLPAESSWRRSHPDPARRRYLAMLFYLDRALTRDGEDPRPTLSACASPCCLLGTAGRGTRVLQLY